MAEVTQVSRDSLAEIALQKKRESFFYSRNSIIEILVIRRDIKNGFKQRILRLYFGTSL